MTKRKDLTDTIALYEEIVSGKRQRMPKGTWNPLKGGYDNFRKVIRYLVLDKLKMDREALIKTITHEWLEEHHLRKGLEYTYEDYYSMVANCFPEFDIQPWEMNFNPLRQQTEPVEILRWLITEKLGWNREQIVHNFSGHTLRQHGLYKLYQSGRELSTGGRQVRIFDLLAKAYPEYAFKASEFKWFDRK